MPVIPLRVHSHWSLLEGVPSIAEIVDFARDTGLPAIALTDTHALYGAIEFVQRCRKANLQPIIGVDFTFERDHALVLLACSMIGYANLCRLVTRLQSTPRREQRLADGLSAADLIDRADGLVALSDGYRVSELLDRFGRDRFFIDLQIGEDSDVARAGELQALAEQLGVRTVATRDIRYLSPNDAARYRVLTAMRTGQRVGALPPLPDRSFWSEEDVRRRFARFPQAIANSEWIANLCRFDFPLDQIRFPALDLPPGRTLRDELATRVFAGAKQRYREISPPLEARLAKEIDVIDTLGYSPYFLVVADIVQFAREQRVPVSPRGSASSSVVAYCLGIHDVDPIAHDLYFERFLSLERHDPPDIDLDLCSHRRDEVIDYVYRKYGADHVAMVCTYATLQPRSALREVAKAYGLTEARISQLADGLPRFAHARPSIGSSAGRQAWHPAMRQQGHAAQADMIEQARDPIEREVIEMSQLLTGTPHHLSIHPGGIVIAPGAITDLVPLQYATKGLLITQFDLKGIEQLGLVKIDLLGISALTVIADSVALIQQREPQFRIEAIPNHDPAAAQALSTGHTIGCFQIESPGMRFTLRELATHSIDDLIVALALYRPGPLKGGLKDAFVRRHLRQETAEYLHPALEPILRETYGVILYQEQVLRIAHEVAGFTLGEADLLRRAMSKFRSAHEMARLREQFVTGAQQTSSLERAIAEQVWELMAVFAGYGFPKAHAAGYAALAYRMAYLKTHYPAEFMAARLAVWGGFYSPRVYMSEARHLGLSVKPPHINHSAEAFTLDRSDLRTLWMGLGQVRELTHASIESILKHRPFTSLEDFMIRTRPLHVEALNLVKCGALDGLGDSAAMLTTLESEPWHGRHSPQLRMMLTTLAAAHEPPTVEQRASWEKEILGHNVSIHPLELLTERLAREGVVPSTSISQCIDQPIVLGGLRIGLHHVQAPSETMWLVDMEDQHGLYQVLWGGAALRSYRALLNRREPVIVRGRVKHDRQGQPIVIGAALQSI